MPSGKHNQVHPENQPERRQLESITPSPPTTAGQPPQDAAPGVSQPATLAETAADEEKSGDEPGGGAEVGDGGGVRSGAAAEEGATAAEEASAVVEAPSLPAPRGEKKEWGDEGVMAAVPVSPASFKFHLHPRPKQPSRPGNSAQYIARVGLR